MNIRDLTMLQDGKEMALVYMSRVRHKKNVRRFVIQSKIAIHLLIQTIQAQQFVGLRKRSYMVLKNKQLIQFFQKLTLFTKFARMK